MLPDFQSFSSIPRLKRDCTITEKIDGTNGQVWISDDLSIVQAGSRNRWITPEDDNYGFATWAKLHENELRTLGPGHHFGEWWGSGIQRRYGLAEKRFSLFNTGRWDVTDPAKAPPGCCLVVPVLYQGPFSSDAVDEMLARLSGGGSIAAPGFMNPEGVVVFLSASRQLFKVTLGGDGHKSTAKRPETSNQSEAA